MKNLIIACGLFLSCLSCATKPLPTPTVDRDAHEAVAHMLTTVKVIVKASGAAGESVAISGSGVVVFRHGLRALVATAGHVCTLELPFPMVKYEMLVENVKGQMFRATPRASDRRQDVCIVMTQGIPGPTVAVSRELPPLGARVMIAGAPKGVWGPGAAVLSDMRYCGVVNPDDEENTPKIVLSGSSSTGASGGPVFYRGQVVGLVVAVSMPFGHPVFASVGSEVATMLDSVKRSAFGIK